MKIEYDKQKGMTAIEMGIVLMVIAIMATIGFVAMGKKDDAKVLKAVKQIEGIYQNVQNYSFTNNGVTGIADADCTAAPVGAATVLGGGAISCAANGNNVDVTYPVPDATQGALLASRLKTTSFQWVAADATYAGGNVTVTVDGN